MSIPFYQLMPALKCYDFQGELMDQSVDLVSTESTDNLKDGHCSVSYACNAPAVDKWEIDWEADTTLHNWTTDLNLICEEPYKIALIGTIGFISYGIGAAIFANLTDDYGRKKVFIAMVLTPIIG